MASIQEDGQLGSPEQAQASDKQESLAAIVAGSAWKLTTAGPRLALKLSRMGANQAERMALQSLRKRLDSLDTGPTTTDQEAAQGAAPAKRGTTKSKSRSATSTPQAIMAHLMESSLEQNPESAEILLALRTARQLVPDEARILAALADGHSSALMHLASAPLVGPASQRWLENLSPVGREAGVCLIHRTSQYIGHLRALGLLESGDEDKSLQLKYQLLEADTQVRKTAAEIDKTGHRPKYLRRTIRMSETGRQFWQRCEPKDQQSW